MNRYEFEYCGINSRTDLHLVMGHVALPIAPTISESTVSIPNKYGNEYYGTSWESKVISIPCTMPAVDYETYVQTLQNLTNVFVNLDDDPAGTEYPLVFGINPDVTYYGHFTQIPTPTFMSETVTDVQFTLEFTMSDPRGFLPKQTIALNGGIDNKVTPAGNAPTEPIISIIPKRTIYYCGYVLNGGQVAIGTDDQDELADPTPKYETVVNDPMTTLANFSTDATVISPMTDHGSIKSQGSFSSTGGTIIVKPKDRSGHRDWGTVYAGWGGPMGHYTKGPTTVLDNWRIEGFIDFRKWAGTHSSRAIARAGYLITDSNGQTIGRMEITDNVAGGGRSPVLYIQITKPGGKFDAGDGIHHTFYNKHGDSRFFKNGKSEKVKIPYKRTVTVKTKKKGKKGKTTVTSQKKNVTKTETVDNLNHTDVFSTFYGKMWIEKDGNEWSYGVIRYNLNTHLPYKDKKYAFSYAGKWYDSNGTFSGLKLGSFGIIAMKHGIQEDLVKPPVKYHEPYISFGNVKIQKVNSVKERSAQPIANANDEIIINTEDQQVMVNGEVSGFQASTDWPKLNGGKVNDMMFAGDIADADIQLQLTPKIK
ncbi:phage tail domain-containing protein [Pediococcus ethanolidurans]|uniref:phage tail domain-containing protein n=1 Tax=Pediococcus ethanolidurans TaxID=319653 RepID=UPI001C1E9136|nr:phage tail domain-containing protein [Pediococcus ethanolidurans]MBU7554441.1 phage tail family protein [Pediococcus ethanolidurans]